MTHYPITKVKTGRRGEVFGPFRDDYYQEQLNLGCDRDILDNPEDYLKCSFKELPVQVGETFTGIVSLRFSDRSSERYWKLIIQDPTDLPVQPYHNTDDNEYSDTDDDGCIECIDTDEELDSVLGLS